MNLVAQLAIRCFAVVCRVVPSGVHKIVVLRVQLPWLRAVCLILFRSSFARIVWCSILASLLLLMHASLSDGVGSWLIAILWKTMSMLCSVKELIATEGACGH